MSLPHLQRRLLIVETGGVPKQEKVIRFSSLELPGERVEQTSNVCPHNFSQRGHVISLSFWLWICFPPEWRRWAEKGGATNHRNIHGV